MATQQEYEQMSAAEKKKEDWMNSKWRPAMGWVYMATCVTDFVLFPILWSLLQTVTKQPITQWQPLTLQGAGLFHVAMGAVLGLAAWGRTQEKLNGANNGGISLPSSMPAASGPAPAMPATSFTPAPSWGTTPIAAPAPAPVAASVPAPAFGSPAPVVTSSSGKPAPVQPDFPER